MDSLLLVFGGSLLACLLIIPLVRLLAFRVGLVDRPDGRRKIHGQPIPVMGGIAVYLSVWSILGLALLLPHTLQATLFQVPETAATVTTTGSGPASTLPSPDKLLLGLFLASTILVGVGVYDDLRGMRGRYKLAMQIVAILVLIQVGGVNVEIVSVFGWPFYLGTLAVPFTVLLMLGAINSLNLIDGMDGLLGSVGWWLCLALASMAALSGQWWATLVALALAGSLLGFLRYNLPPATIFMGDAGSMLVGLIVGTLSIRCSLKGPTTIALLLPMGLMAMPFFDTTAAIIRRKLTGRSIYDTDRGHMHHIMLRRGLSTRNVLLIVSACCLVTCAGVLASQALKNEWIILLTTLSVVATLIFTGLFGYAEAMLIRERFVSLFQPTENGRQMEVRLQGSRDWRQLWNILTEEAERLDLQQLLLDVNAPALHEGYHARWDRFRSGNEDTPNLWRCEIPLSADGHSVGRLEIAGQTGGTPVWVKLEMLTRLVESHVSVRPQPPAEAPAGPAHRLELVDLSPVVTAGGLN
jgi:UDP-GlcNAc:undecaprenyl-phosphate/decaprenyl-phosphate GlcNAc-1-phosphate transferase